MEPDVPALTWRFQLNYINYLFNSKSSANGYTHYPAHDSAHVLGNGLLECGDFLSEVFGPNHFNRHSDGLGQLSVISMYRIAENFRWTKISPIPATLALQKYSLE